MHAQYEENVRGSLPNGLLVRVGTTSAPAAIGPYSAGLLHESTGLIFVSGQLPIDPSSGQLVVGGTRVQALQALSNATAVVEAAGGCLAGIGRVVVYLTDLGEAEAVNKAYGEFFGDVRPVRTMVGVASLPLSSAIEVEMTAVK